MFDVRDLEGPVERGAWAVAPDAVRAACALLVSVVALTLLRGWMVVFEWREFQHAYGSSRGWDMSTPAGWAQAELSTPGEWSVLVDAVAVVLLVLAVLAVLHRFSEARSVSIVLSALLVVDTLAPLAYPVPWWFVVASSLLAAYGVVMIVLMLRSRTRMHVRPEPLSLREPQRMPGERL